MLFNFSIVVLLISVIASVFSALNASVGEGPSETVTIIAIVAVCIFSLIMFCVMFSFFGFHCWLIITGQTTREQIKHWRGKQGSGVLDGTSDGSSSITGRTLACLHRPRSRIHPRSLVDPLLAQNPQLSMIQLQGDEKVGARRSSES